MVFSDILTTILRPCTNVPKSPQPPSPQKVTALKQADSRTGWTSCTDEVTPFNGENSPSPTVSADPKAWAGAEAASSQAAPKASEDRTEFGDQSPAKKMITVVEESQEDSDKLILETFGYEVLQQLQGAQWDERGLAVQSVRARVVQSALGASPPEAFFQAAQAVAMVALRDKVMPVFFDGLDLVKLLLGDFAAGIQPPLSKEVLARGADSIIPVIVQKTSDRNARSIEATRQALVFLSKQPAVGCQQVMSHILASATITAKDHAAIRGRLECMEHFIAEFGFDKKNSGLSLGAVMTFVRTHLEAADEKVRRAAVEVTVKCYTLKGDRTMKYCANLKPALLKLLEQRFNEVDGKSKKNAKPRRTVKRKPLERNSAFSGGQAPALVPKKPLGPLAPVRSSSRETAQPVGLAGAARGEEDNLDDILSSDVIGSAVPLPSEPLSSPAMSRGLIVDPIAPEENPNFIPSPKVEDENLIDGLMNEIEGL